MFNADPAGASAASDASASSATAAARSVDRTLTDDLPAAARQVLATLMGIGQSRLALATVELDEERLRLARLLMACTATLFFGFLGAVLLTAWVVLWSEPINRLTVLAVLTAAAAAAAGLAAWWWRSLAATKPPLLQATLDALRDDGAAWFGSPKP
jgi:uncharacterized membrane protein YqjE